MISQKTDQENPKWFMVDVTFSRRAKHFTPLALFRYIATLSPSELPSEIAYVSENGVKAIKGPFGGFF
jgi:predicted RNA-binding protein with PUA-like domain